MQDDTLLGGVRRSSASPDTTSPWRPPVAMLVAALLLNLLLPLHAVDLADYRQMDPGLPVAPTVRNPDFETDTTGWVIRPGYSVDPAGGRNGTAGLRYERSDPRQYVFTSTGIALKPGTRYRYGVWVRCKDVTANKGVGASMCLEFSRNGKWLSGDYPTGVAGDADWTYIESVQVVPEKATSCRLLLYMARGCTGTAWFDDIRVETDRPRVEMHVVAPATGTVTPADGRIRVNVYNEDRETKARPLLVHVEGTARKTVKRVTVLLNGQFAEADLSGLPVGNASLKLALLDPQDKRVLAETESRLSVVPADRPVPSNACLIDRRGRAVVDGKPFLPVGLFMYILPRPDVDRIAESPFNCVMSYQSLKLSLREQDDMMVPRQPPEDTSLTYTPTRAGISAALDYCHARGLKVIFSLHRVYEGTKWSRTSWFGAEGETQVVTRAVTAFRSHPALLAWYVNDERPATMMARLNARRRLVNALDPFHPTWAVLYQFPDLPQYGSSCDLIGVDMYPINNEGSRNMGGVNRAMDAVDRTGLPAWVVPQIFNWGIYRAGGKADTFRREFRDPTEEQVRAMTLLFALRGAKGFVFYCYHDLKRPMGPNRFDTPPQTREDFERRWAEVCRVAGVLRELEPFLLADKDAPKAMVEAEEGDVQVREFRDARGNVRILVAGIGPGKSSAVITTSAALPLHSVYGNCVPLGDNRYRFVGTDICADILTNQGQSTR